jgi:vancomycin permeability regulator SanA
VQKANYKNLRLALADNAESKQEMNVFRNFRYAQIGLVVAGAGILAYEMVRQNEAANTSSDESIRFTPMVALGLVLGGSSYLLERPKQDAKWFAVDNYNK